MHNHAVIYLTSLTKHQFFYLIFFVFVTEPLSQNLKPIPGMVTITPLAPGLQTVKRFSHASVLIKGRYVVTTGGFGEVDGRHQRLQEISVTDITTLESKLIRCSSDEVQCKCVINFFLKCKYMCTFFICFPC